MISDADLSALVELLREVGIHETMQRVASTAPVTQTKPRGSKVGVKRGKYNTKRKQEVLDSLIKTEAVIKESRTIIKEATANLNQARELNQELLVEARKRGITNVEIANALGVTDSSIVSRYQTARKHIRKRNTTK